MAPTTSMSTATALLKRESESSKYSLYILCIIVGCIAFALIGSAIWSMYHGIDDEDFIDIPYHQRKYMREVRRRNLNGLAVAARRPDMIIPVEELNY